MVTNMNFIVTETSPIRLALEQLNKLGNYQTIFVLNAKDILVGTLTDGDIRRGLLKNKSLEMPVSEFMNSNFRYLLAGQYSLDIIDDLKKSSIKVIPIVDKNLKIKKLINLKEKKSILPIDAIIMAGGRGERLRPLTDTLPKPMLIVGDKPIIEQNIDRLIDFGIDNITITVKYLSHIIEEHFGDGKSKDSTIKYIKEFEPLGTIGSVSMVEEFLNNYVLVMNSDLLTNIDFEDFFRYFLEQKADFAVATIPYNVTVPYAVLETENDCVVSFKEKPTFTYYSSAGIYLFKKELISKIPKNSFYNATDFMESLINSSHKVSHYPILGYWLDIGKHDDFAKAQQDINHIKF